MFKFADDTYLLTGSSQAHTIPSELHLISTWASANNLTLNSSKSKEMIIFRPRHQFDPPPPLPNITRVKTLKILGLGVILQDNLKLTAHIDHLTLVGRVNLGVKLIFFPIFQVLGPKNMYLGVKNSNLLLFL